MHTITPDVATASEDYARSFAGPSGAFFLAEQEQAPAFSIQKAKRELGSGRRTPDAA